MGKRYQKGKSLHLRCVPAALLAAGICLPQAAKADVTLSQGDGVVPSVIAYLRVDAGLRVNGDVDMTQYNGKKGTGTVVQAGGNDWGTSMFGVHGTSDFSPDLSAVYRVESGFSATDGRFNSGTNSIFNRRAYGGLSNKQFGTLTAGKNLFIDNDIWDYDPMVQENMSTATLVNGRNWQGASDMIEYRSPNWGGFQLGGQASFGNGDTGGTITPYKTTKVSNMYGVSLKYTVGPVSLLAVYDEIQDANGHLTSIFSSSREGLLGATLDVNKSVKLYGGYERLSAPDASFARGGTGTVYSGYNPSAITTTSITTLVNGSLNTTSTTAPAAGGVFATGADMGWFGAGIQVTPEVIVRAAWFYTDVNKHGGHANLATAGIEYYFSKNAFIYLTLGEVLNAGKADFSADIGAPPPRAGKSQFAGFNGVSIQF